MLLRAMAVVLLALTVGVQWNGPCHAQTLVFANSDPSITVHSNFTGQTITLFGNVEPDRHGDEVAGPFDVIVLGAARPAIGSCELVQICFS